MQTIEVIGPKAGERVNVLGAEVTIKSHGDPAQMTFADHPIPPGYGVPMHVHQDEDELFYILEGEVTLQTPDGELTAGPGCFVHAPRGAPHGFCNASEQPARALVITSPGGALDGVMRGLDAASKQGPLDLPKIGAITAANRIRML